MIQRKYITLTIHISDIIVLITCPTTQVTHHAILTLRHRAYLSVILFHPAEKKLGM